MLAPTVSIFYLDVASEIEQSSFGTVLCYLWLEVILLIFPYYIYHKLDLPPLFTKISDKHLSIMILTLCLH
jgi:hypothetical protein